MNVTKRLYYEDFYITETIATVIDIDKDKGIVFDKTIAFPEGGGQEGDQGILIPIDWDNVEIPFYDTQKGVGSNLYIDNFPVIQVNTPIYHKVEEKYYNYFEINKQFKIKINIERRGMLTLNHTGIHAVLMGIEQLRPNFSKAVYGAHISPKYARIDFNTGTRFTQDDLKLIKEYVDNLYKSGAEVKSYNHPGESEAWYWECDGVVYPCGGTHLTSLSYLGEVTLKRKNIGKNAERIIAEFHNPALPIDLYNQNK
ncbi:MAG: hypothetical protein RR840_10525 [Clostridium sp.]